MKAETKRKPQPPKKRHWCLTEHTTTNFRIWKNLDLVNTGIRYLVYQLEQCPKTNKLHIQGYVEFYSAVRMTQVKTRLGSTTVHLEARKGTRVQARDYCCKEDTRVIGTEPVHLGIFSTKQGHRTDLEQVTDMVTAGATEYEIMQELPTQHIKFYRGIARQIQLREQQRLNHYTPISVNVLWGKTRSGKTRSVFAKHGAHNVYVAQINENGKLWFDGYNGQKVLLINEFYGQYRAGAMLELLDNYRKTIEVKGGTTVSNWDHVYITSNCHPEEWYKHWESVPQLVMEAFIARFDDVTYMESKVKPKNLTWSKFGKHSRPGSSITPATSVPHTSPSGYDMVLKDCSAFFAQTRLANAEQTIPPETQRSQASGAFPTPICGRQANRYSNGVQTSAHAQT